MSADFDTQHFGEPDEYGVPRDGRTAYVDIPTMILQGIRDFSANRPRSLQKEIGPSGLGTPCDHCLAAALVGWERAQDEAWLPLIGTAVHELLLGEASPWHSVARLVEPDGTVTEHGGWLKEKRVDVGTIAGERVSGNADLFHVPSGTVVDLKIVGATTLNEARRHGASQQYRWQVQLYARGFQLAGYEVNACTIAFLPRNSMRLSDAVFCTYPYDVDIADDALNRAEKMLADARYLESISERARDVWIDSLPRAAGCYDCARYPIIVPRKSELQEFATGGA